MVHQVLADAGEVDEGGDAVLLELILGADASAVEDVGAAVGTAADDDLLGGLGLDDTAVSEDGPDARGAQLAVSVALDDGLVDVDVGDNVDVVLDVLLGDEVGASRAQAVGDGPGRVAAAVGVLSVGEHVVVQGQALVLHGLPDEVRDGC